MSLGRTYPAPAPAPEPPGRTAELVPQDPEAEDLLARALRDPWLRDIIIAAHARPEQIPVSVVPVLDRTNLRGAFIRAREGEPPPSTQAKQKRRAGRRLDIEDRILEQLPDEMSHGAIAMRTREALAKGWGEGTKSVHGTLPHQKGDFAHEVGHVLEHLTGHEIPHGSLDELVGHPYGRDVYANSGILRRWKDEMLDAAAQGRQPDDPGFGRWMQSYFPGRDPDDPRHYYDYRAAYAAGARPDEMGHMDSRFKSLASPERYVPANSLSALLGYPPHDTIRGENVARPKVGIRAPYEGEPEQWLEQDREAAALRRGSGEVTAPDLGIEDAIDFFTTGGALGLAGAVGRKAGKKRLSMVEQRKIVDALEAMGVRVKARPTLQIGTKVRHNGRTGTVVSFVRNEGNYWVDFGDDTPLLLDPLGLKVVKPTKMK